MKCKEPNQSLSPHPRQKQDILAQTEGVLCAYESPWLLNFEWTVSHIPLRPKAR